MKRTSSPGQSYNFVRIATRAEHTGTTLAFCLATELQRMTHTIARISARTHPNRSRSCRATQDITSGCIGRAWQHTTNKRRFVPHTCPHKCSAQASVALPRSIRPIEHQQRSDSSVPCSFWSFSNGGKVNSACEQVMAQTTLSMTVRSVRKAAEVRVGGMLQCGHSRAWRMLGFGCAYLSVLTAVLCCAWRRDGTGRLACLGPGEAQCRPSESSGYG